MAKVLEDLAAQGEREVHLVEAAYLSAEVVSV